MRTTRSLPGSKFRLVAVASLAALAVGSTVVGSGADDTSEQPASEATELPTGEGTDGGIEPEETESEITPATPSAVDELDINAPATSVVGPSTAAATPEVDGDEPPGVTVVEAAAVTVDGDPAPVSGVPVVVGVEDTNACPAPTASDGDTASITNPSVPADDATESATAPTANPSPAAAPTTVPTVPATGPAADGAPGATSVSFDDGAAGWVVLSGSWSAVDGQYLQTDETGYDFISQYPGDVGSEYAATVRLRALGDSLGGGLIVGQPVPGSRRGATLIDFTDGGRFLRWGRYDADTGQYQYVGGVATGDAFDVSAEHSLTVEVRATRTLVVVDGAAIGEFGPIGSGRIGLVTSLSAVAFDDLEIVDL